MKTTYNALTLLCLHTIFTNILFPHNSGSINAFSWLSLISKRKFNENTKFKDGVTGCWQDVREVKVQKVQVWKKWSINANFHQDDRATSRTYIPFNRNKMFVKRGFKMIENSTASIILLIFCSESCISWNSCLRSHTCVLTDWKHGWIKKCLFKICWVNLSLGNDSSSEGNFTLCCNVTNIL